MIEAAVITLTLTFSLVMLYGGFRLFIAWYESKYND